MQMVGGNDGNQFRQYAGQNVGNLNGYNDVQNVRNQNPNGNGILVAARAEGNATGHNGNRIRCYNCRGKEEAGIQLQAEEFDLMAAAADLDEIEEVNANCILMANLQQHRHRYTELLEPIPEPHQVPQNDNNVISEVSSVEQSGGIVEQHPANVEETRVLYDSLYHNLAIEVEKVNTVNHKLRETNAKLTTELLSMEKSTVSSLLEEKKKLKPDFKIREDELLDKQIQLEKRIKELDNILVKTGQSIQTIHMLSPKPDSFYHTEQKMALGYQNPFYLKQAQQKQQSLYDGKVLLEKHDPPVVHDSEETLQLCEECKFDKISYDKAYDDMQQNIERLQAQLGDLKGKSKDTSCVSDTLNPLSQKLENENMELEFQVLNYAKENAHLKTTYKNLFDSISVTRTQTKMIIDSLQNKIHNTIYENAKLRAQLFDKVSHQKDITCGMSANTKFAKQSILGKPPKVGETHALSKPVTSNLIPTPQGSKVMKNDKVIAPGMFRFNPFKPSREEKHVPNKIRASVRTNPITVSQPPIITKKDVNSDSNGLSSTGNDREDIGKLGAKGDIGFFIGYSADSCAYRVYNRRTKKIMETMNVSFDELSAMAFEQRNSKLDTAPTPINSSYQATNFPNTSQDVDEINSQQQHAQQQGNQAQIQPEIVADNVPNAMFNANTFVNPFATPSTSATESSSSQYVDPSNMHKFYQPYPHEFQWTKDHPLEQVIGEPSQAVLTMNQLRSDGDMCMYALTVSTMESKNVKETMTDPAWIESMQEELL
uniref:Retroviral polymerase SH3-like domain-containing protein n=1 Tax=Tanacetum cinerariifolium TaxID=118510 RepID=A0A6L2LDI1_TANCI|nr:hypothetical protein [Tanacetum cinerariifolium]